MNNYSEYASILNRIANVRLTFFLVFSIIAIGVLIWNYHDIKMDKEDKFLTGCIIFLLIMTMFTWLPHKIDIKNENYITYTGEFYVKEFIVGTGSERIWIKKEDEDKVKKYNVIRNTYDDANVKNGNIYQYIEEDTSYKGTFVYSKYSNVLVDIYVETKIE